MRHLKSAMFALGVGLFAAGAALAADGDCCKDKAKPCCEEKDGKKMPCCDKHKGDHKGHHQGKAAPAAPKPAPEPHAEHKH